MSGRRTRGTECGEDRSYRSTSVPAPSSGTMAKRRILGPSSAHLHPVKIRSALKTPWPRYGRSKDAAVVPHCTPRPTLPLQRFVCLTKVLSTLLIAEESHEKPHPRRRLDAHSLRMVSRKTGHGHSRQKDAHYANTVTQSLIRDKEELAQMHTFFFIQ